MADTPSESGKGLPDEIGDLMKALGVDPTKATPPPVPDPGTAPMAPKSPTPALPGEFPPAVGEPPDLEAFQEKAPDEPVATIEMLKDVTLNARIEVGRTRMYVQDILRLSPGSVVELDRLTGDPLELYVNDRLVARGEILVLNENFAIRITEVINPAQPQEPAS